MDEGAELHIVKVLFLNMTENTQRKEDKTWWLVDTYQLSCRFLLFSFFLISDAYKSNLVLDVALALPFDVGVVRIEAVYAQMEMLF